MTESLPDRIRRELRTVAEGIEPEVSLSDLFRRIKERTRKGIACDDSTDDGALRTVASIRHAEHGAKGSTKSAE